MELSGPVQGGREGQDGPGSLGCVCLSVARSRPAGSFEHRREPRMFFILGMHVGCLFFWLLFFGQAKKSNSSIKDEKQDKNINQRLKRKQSLKGCTPAVRQHKKDKNPLPEGVMILQ